MPQPWSACYDNFVKRSSSSAKRDRASGLAAIEFSLWLVVLLPLVLGMIDFGHYFYISVTAAEAARVGARTAAKVPMTPNPNCANTTLVSATALQAQNAATAYMSQAGLGSITTSPTAACTTDNGLTPVWRMQVKVDFVPLIGFVRSLMKTSTQCTGCVTFTQVTKLLGS